MSFSDLETMSLHDFIARNRGDDGTLWFFQHIPKTAGSSFSAELAKHSGPYFNIFIDSEDRDTPYGDAFAAATARFLSSAETRRFRSASGHLSIDLVERIRDAHPGPCGLAKEVADFPDLDAYIEGSPAVRNKTVFFLAGVRGGDPAEIVPWILSRFDYIGLLEEMALSHTILSQLLCMPDADVEHRRSTEEVAANAERPTEAQLDRIRAKNRLDEALFNAVSLTHRRLRARSLPEVAA